MSLPIVVNEYVKPISVIHTPKDETIIDMGQNMTGWVRFKVNEPAGTVIKLSHTEILQDECFYNENLRKAKAEYTYVSDGTEKIVEPHFTFYGFRYVMIEGLTKPIELEDYMGCVVYSKLETSGKIATSDSRINQLISNAVWSQKDNFLDVPTDCPQRDERMGWTGDAQMFCKTASYNMETYAFYSKYLRDLWVEQKDFDGMVGHVVPSFIQLTNPISSFWWGSCAWGDASVIMPWTMYQHYGDKTILEKQYESMKAWIDWVVKNNLGPTGLWENGFKFGDWLALDGRPDQEDDRYGGTDTTLVASAYLKYSSELVAKTAAILGNKKDEEYYQMVSDRTKKAIQVTYYKDGISLNRTQTAHVIALAMNLVEDNQRAKIAAGLVELLRENDMHLTTGFVGTPFLCKALSSEGYSEEAYQVLFQKDFPSWLYEVDMGATTIWERWNSVLPDGKISGTGMNSLNHYTYGSIMQWMYENMCGLNLTEIGFKKFSVNPEYTDRFDFAEMEYDCAYGKIQIKWTKKENGYSLFVKVPFDTEAYVTIPGTKETECLKAGEYYF
jgi:alpha-L-rhamnosidase